MSHLLQYALIVAFAGLILYLVIGREIARRKLRLAEQDVNSLLAQRVDGSCLQQTSDGRWVPVLPAAYKL